MASKAVTAMRWRIGCLILLALSFVAIAVVMDLLLWRTMAQEDAAQAWVEVPAIIKQAKLKETFSSPSIGGRHHSSTTYQATATYEYEFGGRQFTGEQVTLQNLSDDLGDFQRNAFLELKRHRDEKKPFRCFVNPRNPQQAVLYRETRWEVLAFDTLFPAVFGAVGFGVLSGAWAAKRVLPVSGPAGSSSDSAWLARRDWATGEIRSGGASTIATCTLAGAAAGWAIGSAPLLVELAPIFATGAAPRSAITLVFPAVGAALGLAFIYQFMRRRKFGPSVLQLTTTPGAVGGQLAGVIRISKAVQAAECYRLRLSCTETVCQANGRTSRVVWQDERLVTDALSGRVRGGIAVPVLFAIPGDAQETSRTKQNPQIAWRLDASAEMRGFDYKARFDVPVFKTESVRTEFHSDEQLVAELAAVPPPDVLLRGAGIRTEPLAGEGVRLIFPGGRNSGLAVSCSLAAAVWSILTWLMMRFALSIVFPILFGLIDLILLWIVAHLWFYRSVVEARPSGLMLQRGWFGLGRTRTIAADRIKQITTCRSVSAGTKVWKSIAVVKCDNKATTIAQAIEGTLEQQAVVDVLNKALGRRGKAGTA